MILNDGIIFRKAWEIDGFVSEAWNMYVYLVQKGTSFAAGCSVSIFDQADIG